MRNEVLSVQAGLLVSGADVDLIAAAHRVIAYLAGCGTAVLATGEIPQGGVFLRCTGFRLEMRTQTLGTGESELCLELTPAPATDADIAERLLAGMTCALARFLPAQAVRWLAPGAVLPAGEFLDLLGVADDPEPVVLRHPRLAPGSRTPRPHREIGARSETRADAIGLARQPAPVALRRPQLAGLARTRRPDARLLRPAHGSAAIAARGHGATAMSPAALRARRNETALRQVFREEPRFLRGAARQSSRIAAMIVVAGAWPLTSVLLLLNRAHGGV
jgi:hypothetical protein